MRLTVWRSWYSDMSSRIIASSSSNRHCASAFASSVFPTPVGPRKMNEPIGRFGSFSPARARRTASLSASMARSCPTTRSCSVSSMRSSFSLSRSSSRETGMPVIWPTRLAMSSSETRSCEGRPAASSARSVPYSSWSWSTSCLMCAARSWSSRATAASASSARASSRLAMARTSGAVSCASITCLLAASSIRSIALSGRRRSVT